MHLAVEPTGCLGSAAVAVQACGATYRLLMSTAAIQQLRRIVRTRPRVDAREFFKTLRDRFLRIAAKIGTPRSWSPRLRRAAQELHSVELEGESAATPAIVLAEVILFLLPIFLAMLGVAFAAYYLSR